MTLRGLRGIGVALCFAITGVTAGHAAAPNKQIPPPPTYYVLDEPHLLDQQATRALQALLIEHDRTTGEQIVVAIFNSLEGEDLNDFTNRVFQKWEIGQREKDNGVLLAIFNQDHKARIEVGYGLEPLLTDVKSSRILRDYLIPGMKAGQPAEAVTQSALQILQTIDSPLVQNGRAQQILRSGGMLRKNINSAEPMKGGWAVWLFLGLVLMVIVSHTISSAEATFTRAGWYRPRPWRRRWWDDDGGPRSGGGGFFGGWGGGGGGWGSGGGDGGFSGGGGRSGGGGASAGW
ncbi:MAG: TPM domain-containing protein [Bdellovibrionia bacterium]